MPRIRTVKPEFWADEKLGPMAIGTRLVFLGLISMADDAGRLVDSEKQIDAFIFPYTSESATIRGALHDLSTTGRVQRGETASGQKVIQITNWHHQRIDKPNLKGILPPILRPFQDESTTIPRRVGDTLQDTSAPLSVPVSGSVPVSTTVEGEGDSTTATGNGISEILQHIPVGYRMAVHGALRAAQNPVALTHELLATQSGMHGPGYSWDVIGRAIQEMAASGIGLTARSLRACCRKVVEGEPQAQTPESERTMLIKAAREIDIREGRTKA